MFSTTYNTCNGCWWFYVEWVLAFYVGAVVWLRFQAAYDGKVAYHDLSDVRFLAINSIVLSCSLVLACRLKFWKNNMF